MKEIELLEKKRTKAWYKKWWGITILIFVLIVIVFIILVAYQGVKIYKDFKSGSFLSPALFEQNAPHDMNLIVDELAPWTGNENATIRIVEFGDFNCSACASASLITKQLRAKHDDKIKFYWRNYPVISKSSIDLANAATCSHQQNKFWEFHDAIFQFPDEKTAADARELVGNLGLDMIKYDNCLINPLTEAQLRKDVFAAADGLVQRTPTFFINGFSFEGAIPLEKWEEIIDMLLDIYDKK